jgi:hypothetical protein
VTSLAADEGHGRSLGEPVAVPARFEGSGPVRVTAAILQVPVYDLRTEVEKLRSSRKIAPTTWCSPREGAHHDLDAALAGRIGREIDDA